MQSVGSTFTEMLVAMVQGLATAIFVVFGGGASDGQGAAQVSALVEPRDLQVRFYAGEDVFDPQSTIAFGLGQQEGLPPSVTLTMSKLDAASFGDFTARHVGDLVALEVCGVEVSAPRVVEAIRGGQIQVTGQDVVTELSGFMAAGCP